MKLSLTAILLFALSFFSFGQTINYRAPERIIYCQIYCGTSFLEYRPQPGLLELSFPYSRLDTSSGGQIPETFSFSKKGLPGKNDFTFPILGGEISNRNFFIRADFRLPQKRRISNEHISLGYEWKKNYYEKSNTVTLLAGIKKNIPDWVSSVFIRAEAGFDFYKPIWQLGELPVRDTILFVMGYIITKANSNSKVREVGVFYEENIVAFIPSLTLGFGTSKNKIDFALSLSPFFPVLEKGGIRLLYKKNNTGWVEPYTWFWYPYKNVIQPGQSGFVEKYNGETVSKTPYRLSGLEISLRIGFHII